MWVPHTVSVENKPWMLHKDERKDITESLCAFHMCDTLIVNPSFKSKHHNLYKTAKRLERDTEQLLYY